jgi:hypothetical protein
MADVLVDTEATPSQPSSGTAIIYVDATQKRVATVDDAGVAVIYPTSDTTAPQTQAMGDAASSGTNSNKFARIDHKHAMPTLGYGISNNAAPAVGLTTATQASGTTATTINAATYIDVTNATISLAAGTWLVIAYINGSAANLAFLAHAAIRDGSNNVQAEGSQFVPASGTTSVHAWANICLSVIVTPGVTTSYKISCARGLTTLTNTWTAQPGSGFNTTNNADDASGKGTQILAVRIA